MEFEMDIDFDNLTEEQHDDLMGKAFSIARKVSDSQIDTQNKVVYISNRNGINLSSNIVDDVTTIMGKKCYISPKMTLLKIFGSVSSSYVLTNIQMVRPIVIEIHNKVSHITITNCKNLIIKIFNTSFAGIECINSRKINLSVKAINFIRVTTGSDINLYGECDETSMLDIRNSINITINSQLIPGCMFNEDRFSYSKGEFHKVKETDDIFSSGNLSLPSITLLKAYKT